MRIKTSFTHPLRIDSVKLNESSGDIGMTLCPGKHQLGALTGSWFRDLDMDLSEIKQWDTEILISLNEPHEFDAFSVTQLPEKVKALGMQWMHFPIRDRGIPNSQFELLWESRSHLIKDVINSGSNVVIHCLGGLGRTGMVSARLLIEMGMYHEKAMQLVREARPGAIETYKQECYVRKLIRR